MTETGNHSPGIASLAGRFTRTALGLLRNRSELLVLEWQEEKARVLEVLVLGTLSNALRKVVLKAIPKMLWLHKTIEPMHS